MISKNILPIVQKFVFASSLNHEAVNPIKTTCILKNKKKDKDTETKPLSLKIFVNKYVVMKILINEIYITFIYSSP